MVKTVTFFNNKGGVGKTTLVYHLAWMLSELGYRIIALDFDPQCNLSSMFLPTERMEEILEEEEEMLTVISSIEPVVAGEPYNQVHIEEINERLGVVVGNLALSAFEDKLSETWLKCLDGDIYSFKVTSIFDTIIKDVRGRWEADYVLIDVGPNLGAINRAVIISSDAIVLPVASDLFSLQGIKNLGDTLANWRKAWSKRKEENPRPDTLKIPHGEMRPSGYIVMQYTAKERRPVKSYLRWANRIPEVYNQYVLKNKDGYNASVETDPHCIGLLKHYYSLAPMAMEVHKPLFLLKPADGAIGSHMYAVNKSYEDFKKVAEALLKAI